MLIQSTKRLAQKKKAWKRSKLPHRSEWILIWGHYGLEACLVLSHCARCSRLFEKWNRAKKLLNLFMIFLIALSSRLVFTVFFSHFFFCFKWNLVARGQYWRALSSGMGGEKVFLSLLRHVIHDTQSTYGATSEKRAEVIILNATEEKVITHSARLAMLGPFFSKKPKPRQSEARSTSAGNPETFYSKLLCFILLCSPLLLLLLICRSR